MFISAPPVWLVTAAMCLAGLFAAGCAPGDGATTKPPSQLPAPTLDEAVARLQPLKCDPGWADCDGGRDNGCETGLDASEVHCGACALACSPGAECVAGSCTTGIVEIAAGGSHTCARRADGSLSCWGLNGVGQLGLGGRKARLQPVVVAGAHSVVQVSTGRYLTCARHSSGAVSCWGDGGLLGSKRVAPRATPTLLDGIDGATALAAGTMHGCAVVAGGSVRCWGSNVAGQLGVELEPEDNDLAPVQVSSLSGAVDVAVGRAHSCALLADGSLRCWGMNRFGQLGDGGSEAGSSPRPVKDLSDVVQLSAGGFHTCAVGRDGGLHCWGRNDAGQLGLGDQLDRKLPTASSLSSVAQVSAGLRHTCARLRNGQVLCWGDNEGGRLGDGTDEDRALPTPVIQLSAAHGVSAGAMHGCALLADGGLRCWGVNDGQLGDGSSKARFTPTAVAPPEAS